MIWNKAWTIGYFAMFILHLLVTLDLYLIVNDPFKPQKARNPIYWKIMFGFVLIFVVVSQAWTRDAFESYDIMTVYAALFSLIFVYECYFVC